ncbi:MAG: transglycosylase SLT domain-containing protein [Mariprofundales bacterium]
MNGSKNGCVMELIGAMVVLACSLLLSGQGAAAATLVQQRVLFQQARNALAHHDMARVQTLRQQMGGYPLASYLDIRIAYKQMIAGNDAGVVDTIARYPDIPDSRDLHLAWIENLAKRGQWPAVAAQLLVLPSAVARHPQIAMLAAYHSGRRDDAIAQFSKYWQAGNKTPLSLMQVQRAWQHAGNPTNQARWQRIITLMPRQRWRQVRPLLAKLGSADRQLVHHWRAGQKRPQKVVSEWPMPAQPSAHEVVVLTRLLRRLSVKEPLLAWQQSTRLRLAFDQPQWEKLQRKLALRAARHQLSEASAWLQALPASVQNSATRSWRTRLLLQDQRWHDVLESIAAMPKQQRHQSEWAYWQARALEKQGDKEAANLLFTALAQERGYFSFLSAEQMGIPYQMGAQPLAANPKDLQHLARLPGIVRAHEWLLLGLKNKARREWFRALQKMTPAKWRAAATIASRWNWYDRAILAALRGEAVNALEQRFPMAYSHQVRVAAKQSGLSSSLIWSIIRQESAFNVQASSGAGAKGLMQLMPRTAAMVWKQEHKRRKNHRPNLLDAATNVHIGSRYLAKVKRRFDGNVPLAAAAYNAGSARVKRWLKRQPYREGDLWVASIPFNETRKYVQHVLAYSIVYDWRQNRKHPISISQQLAVPLKVASR